MGEKIESPDAIKAPLKLGLALLKDRNGKIKLDVPVAGRIDDPEFDIAGIISSTIKNIVIKAATSPFKFIASIFGGGEDIKYVEFAAGTSILNEESKSKLDILVNALYERPGVALEIAGFIDKGEDINFLVSKQLIEMVKNAKLKEVTNVEKTSTSINDIEMSSREYKSYLRMLYNTKYVPDITKSITVPEIEAYIKSKIEIADSELKLLINERKKAVNSYMLGSGKVEAGRIFLIESENIYAENIKNIKNSRVELGLK